MTAGHDGTPENDDPFAYLYRNEGGEQPDPAAGGQPGMPRTSYNQVQRVGERRPAQQQPQPQQPGGYGYPQPQQGPPPQQQQYGGQQPGYGYPQQQQQQQPYGAPEYGAPQPPPGGGHRSGGGHQAGGGPGAPNRKGLLIGAVAVVAAVAIGIAFAMTNGSGDDKKGQAADKPTTPAVSSTAPSTQATPSATPTPFDSKPVDAAKLTLGGGAQQSNQWPGANAAGGTYVDHMAQVGASATWTVTVPEDGKYTFFVDYGNAGPDATLTLGVNGTARSGPVNLVNYGKYTDWSKAWNNTTYSWVDLKKGSNTLQLSCQQGNQCGVNLDQVWLKQGSVTK